MAQGGGRVVLYAPDTSKFPNVGLTFEVYDAQGNFLNDLAQGEVSVSENDQPVQVRYAYPAAAGDSRDHGVQRGAGDGRCGGQRPEPL